MWENNEGRDGAYVVKKGFGVWTDHLVIDGQQPMVKVVPGEIFVLKYRGGFCSYRGPIYNVTWPGARNGTNISRRQIEDLIKHKAVELATP